MERLKFQKGKAAFTLRDRLARHRVTHPNNALGATTAVNGDDNDIQNDVDDHDHWFDTAKNGAIQIHTVNNPGSVGVQDLETMAPPDDTNFIPCEATKSEMGNVKLRSLYSRRRTHNEQTLVRPCGVIFARATFFGAEAVSNVLVCALNSTRTTALM